MNTQTGLLNAEVQKRLEGDTAFQTEIASLSDDEKAAKQAEKEAEIREAIFAETVGDRDKHKGAYEGQKKRSEKAEALLKKKGIAVEEDEEEEEDPGDDENALSTADVMLLVENKIPREDIPELQKAAKLLGKSIEDALKDPTVQSILKDRASKRATADATNHGGGKGGAGQVSDAEFLDQVRNGYVPEKGSADAQRLYELRRQGKK